MTRAIALALLLLGSTACVHLPGPLKPAPARRWPATLERALRAAEAGSFGDADRALSAFAATHPRSRQARETLYWRAVFRLDPANRTASSQSAVELLDSYLGRGEGQPHRAEALTLRRIALQLSALDRALSDAADTGAPSRARSEEVAQLKEELRRANEELERIKKRLAAPRP